MPTVAPPPPSSDPLAAGAYIAADIAQVIGGLSERQVRLLAERAELCPSVCYLARSGPGSSLYSFEDLVILFALADLRASSLSAELPRGALIALAMVARDALRQGGGLALLDVAGRALSLSPADGSTLAAVLAEARGAFVLDLGAVERVARVNVARIPRLVDRARERARRHESGEGGEGGDG